jgi:hypothetical protein
MENLRLKMLIKAIENQTDFDVIDCFGNTLNIINRFNNDNEITSIDVTGKDVDRIINDLKQ